MKPLLFKIMGSLRLFTVSVLLVLASCGDSKEEQPLPEEPPVSKETSSSVEDEELVDDLSIDSTQLKHLNGTWRLTHLNGREIHSDHPLNNLKQTFLKDRTWFIAAQDPGVDSVTMVEGGRWSYDLISQQINIFFTADSVPKTVVLKDINTNRMQVESTDGTVQTWSKDQEES